MRLQYRFFLVIQTSCKHLYSFLGPCINSCDAAKALEGTSLSGPDGISAITDLPGPTSLERGPGAPARLILGGPPPRRHPITEGAGKAGRRGRRPHRWLRVIKVINADASLHESQCLHNRGKGMMALSSTSEPGRVGGWEGGTEGRREGVRVRARKRE